MQQQQQFRNIATTIYKTNKKTYSKYNSTHTYNSNCKKNNNNCKKQQQLTNCRNRTSLFAYFLQANAEARPLTQCNVSVSSLFTLVAASYPVTQFLQLIDWHVQTCFAIFQLSTNIYSAACMSGIDDMHRC